MKSTDAWKKRFLRGSAGTRGQPRRSKGRMGMARGELTSPSNSPMNISMFLRQGISGASAEDFIWVSPLEC